LSTGRRILLTGRTLAAGRVLSRRNLSAGRIHRRVVPARSLRRLLAGLSRLPTGLSSRLSAGGARLSTGGARLSTGGAGLSTGGAGLAGRTWHAALLALHPEPVLRLKTRAGH
jgi:hypothetical protein